MTKDIINKTNLDEFKANFITALEAQISDALQDKMIGKPTTEFLSALHTKLNAKFVYLNNANERERTIQDMGVPHDLSDMNKGDAEELLGKAYDAAITQTLAAKDTKQEIATEGSTDTKDDANLKEKFLTLLIEKHEAYRAILPFDNLQQFMDEISPISSENNFEASPELPPLSELQASLEKLIFFQRSEHQSDWLDLLRESYKETLEPRLEKTNAPALESNASSPNKRILDNPVLIPLPNSYAEVDEHYNSGVDKIYTEFTEKLSENNNDQFTKRTLEGLTHELKRQVAHYNQAIPSQEALSLFIDSTSSYRFADNQDSLKTFFMDTWDEVSQEAYAYADASKQKDGAYPIQKEVTWIGWDAADYSLQNIRQKREDGEVFADWRENLLNTLEESGNREQHFNIEEKLTSLEATLKEHNNGSLTQVDSDYIARFRQILTGTHLEWNDTLIENDMSALKAMLEPSTKTAPKDTDKGRGSGQAR